MKKLMKKVYYKLRSKLCFHGFGSYGCNSYMEKPLRLTQKEKIFLGDYVLIRSGVRIEVVNEWFGENHLGEITIGDRTVIEQRCHFVSAGTMRIGKNCLISANVFISNCSHTYSDISKGVLVQSLSVEDTVIGDETFIGYGACIMPGVSIGKHCIIGANSVVTKDIPDYTVVAGAPAKQLKRYDLKTRKWHAI